MEFQLPFREKAEQTGYDFLSNASHDDLRSKSASGDIGGVLFIFGYTAFIGGVEYLRLIGRPDLVKWFILIGIIVVTLGITLTREALIHHYNGPSVMQTRIRRIDGASTSGPIVIKKSVPRHVSWLEGRVKALKQELSPGQPGQPGQVDDIDVTPNRDPDRGAGT